MPLYFFHMHHTDYRPDLAGTEFPSDAQAWREGIRAAGETLKDIDGSIVPGQEYRLECVDSTGRPIFDLRFVAERHF